MPAAPLMRATAKVLPQKTRKREYAAQERQETQETKQVDPGTWIGAHQGSEQEAWSSDLTERKKEALQATEGKFECFYHKEQHHPLRGQLENYNKVRAVIDLSRFPGLNSFLVEEGIQAMQTSMYKNCKNACLRLLDSGVELSVHVPQNITLHNIKQMLGKCLRQLLGSLFKDCIQKALDSIEVQSVGKLKQEQRSQTDIEAEPENIHPQKRRRWCRGFSSRFKQGRRRNQNSKQELEVPPQEMGPDGEPESRIVADPKADCGSADKAPSMQLGPDDDAASPEELRAAAATLDGECEQAEDHEAVQSEKQRCDVSAGFLEEWKVQSDAILKTMMPGFDFTSSHHYVKPRISEVLEGFSWDQVPGDFGIGAVVGHTGSGKSLFLSNLARHLGIEYNCPAPSFQPQSAVCSHPGFMNVQTGESEAVDRLDAVGMNNIPSRLKPSHVLSNGERSRVHLALQAFRSGVVLDDFAAFVDDQGASSMATCLARQVSRLRLQRILIGTTKYSILRFLQPDFVIHAESGAIHFNPRPADERKPKISWDASDLSFIGSKEDLDKDGNSRQGWNGEADQQPLTSVRTPVQLGAGDRTPKQVTDALDTYHVSVDVNIDDVTAQVANAFDYEFTGKIHCELFRFKKPRLKTFTDFTLGVVVGPSGCGKTTILKTFGKEQLLRWNKKKAVATHLKEDGGFTYEQVLDLVGAVALPTAASLRPFHLLSGGEQAQAEIARRLIKGGVIDEFTSCLDRATARKVCLGVAKYLRANRPQQHVIVATVHEDIVPALFADWVMFAKVGEVFSFEGPLPTPDSIESAAKEANLVNFDARVDLNMDDLMQPSSLTFTMRRLEWARTPEAWNIFKLHHYLRSDLMKSLGCIAILVRCGSALVAFHAVATAPGMPPMAAVKAFREHRLVVLPDWQGFGVGPRLGEKVGQLILDAGYRFYSKTAHPRLGASRTASPLWRPTGANMKATVQRPTRWRSSQAATNPELPKKQARLCFSHQFLGTCNGNIDLQDTARMKAKAQRPEEAPFDESKLPPDAPKGHAAHKKIRRQRAFSATGNDGDQEVKASNCCHQEGDEKDMDNEDDADAEEDAHQNNDDNSDDGNDADEAANDEE